MRAHATNKAGADRQRPSLSVCLPARDSLRLFSRAEYSPLPGWGMPRQEGEDFPTAGHVVDYLRAYEQRYDLRVCRPVRVPRGVIGRACVAANRG